MSKSFKYKILALMKEQNISHMQLATKCQVHVQSVYKWSKIEQKDEHSIPADKLRIMAGVFGVQMDDLYNQELITA